jgi:hypothetical protein
MFEFWAICGPVSVVWKVLPQQAHKDWMEHVCHMTMHRTNSKRYLRISDILLVDLSNISLLSTRSSGRHAIAGASASMPSAIAAAPPVIDDCPPSPSIAHQPAASVATCASQPVTNLTMLEWSQAEGYRGKSLDGLQMFPKLVEESMWLHGMADGETKFLGDVYFSSASGKAAFKMCESCLLSC